MLNLTIDHHLSTYVNDDVATHIRNNLYVDNFITSADSVEHLYEIYTKGIRMFSAMGMHLREWQSNSEDFMKIIAEKDKMSVNDSKTTSILGLKWNFGKKLYIMMTLLNMKTN